MEIVPISFVRMFVAIDEALKEDQFAFQKINADLLPVTSGCCEYVLLCCGCKSVFTAGIIMFQSEF